MRRIIAQFLLRPKARDTQQQAKHGQLLLRATAIQSQLVLPDVEMGKKSHLLAYLHPTIQERLRYKHSQSQAAYLDDHRVFAQRHDGARQPGNHPLPRVCDQRCHPR